MIRHPILSILLALMLALTGQSMAVARGASAATGQMVLCTGSGPVAIYVDTQGKPTSAPHICPDSALNVDVNGAFEGIAPPARIVIFRPFAASAATPILNGASAWPNPRAPPVLV